MAAFKPCRNVYIVVIILVIFILCNLIPLLSLSLAYLFYNNACYETIILSLRNAIRLD